MTVPVSVSDAPTIIGVRHHSPACARWVRQCIEQVRPAYVLIEGPADFNPRLNELLLPHQLPIALYAYCQHENDESRSARAWVPFAEWSPEWQALQAAHRQQANIRFIDLPIWAHDEDDDTEGDHAQAYEQALRHATHMENVDALWDHLFEDEAQADVLPTALTNYFDRLRHTQPSSQRDQRREAHMARWIAWAMAQRQGPVVVVCGGWHAPALARQWLDCPSATTPPEVPSPPADAQAVGSYLMPYSEKKLDVLTGYLSGMPAPLWQRWCWEHGQAPAGERLLYTVMSALRHKRQPASTADMGAAHLHAQALAQLRGHRVPLRSDWLDALAGTLIKEALDEPLPWSYRGTLHAGTNPIVVALVDCLAGQHYGTLAADTPQPPLPGDVRRELARVDISPPSTLSLNRLDEQGLQQSQVLHRLKILEIPGIHCLHGSPSVLSADSEEQWQVQTTLHQHAALIEAARYGATLEDAARQRLTAALASASDLSRVAHLLNDAALAGLTRFSQQLLSQLTLLIARESRFDAVGSALEVLYNLWRYDRQYGDIVQATLQAALDRALWLLEATNTVDKPQLNAHLHAWQVLCHILRDQEHLDHSATQALLPLPRAQAVIQRRSQALSAAPLIRGAALGTLIRIEHPTATAESALALLSHCTPLQLGEALQGLMALARHQLTSHTAFVEGFSQQLAQLGTDDFVQALPDLRAAFAWLPPQERSQLAEQVLTHYQLPLAATQLTQPIAVAPERQARNQRLEQYALQRLRQWGVL